MTIRIYDFNDNAVKIEIPDKPIKRIDVIVLSGDETGTIRFEDGTRFDFDASDDRDTDYYDGSYVVEGDDIRRWLTFRSTLGRTAAVEPVLKGDSGLPSGYTELEYIESSGTQYVDTRVVPNNKGGVHYIDKNRSEAAVKTLRRRTERGEERN